MHDSFLCEVEMWEILDCPTWGGFLGALLSIVEMRLEENRVLGNLKTWLKCLSLLTDISVAHFPGLAATEITGTDENMSH